MNSVGRILHNRIYIGEYKHSDVVVPNGIPAVLSEELFDTVQEMLNVNRRSIAKHKAAEEYLLTTKLYCGKCKNQMFGESGKNHAGIIYRYYKCADVKRHGGCDKKSVKKEWIEDLVVNDTVKMLLDDKLIEYIADKIIALVGTEDPLLPAYRSQVDDVQKSISNLIKAMEQGIITESTKQRLEELEAQKKKLNTEIAALESKKPNINKEMIITAENNTDWFSDCSNELSNDGIAWSYKAANVIKAWNILANSKEKITPIKVGVVDTCFDENTQDDLHFAQTFYNEDYHNLGEWYKSNTISSHLKAEFGHGTHVAGVLAASNNGDFGISGVYPYGDNNLYGVSLGTTADNTTKSIYDKSGNGNNYNSAMGFKVALSELILRNVKVINFSFSSGPLDHHFDRVKIITEKEEGWEQKLEELQNNADILGSFLNRLFVLGYDFVLVSAAGNISAADNSTSDGNHLLESQYNSFLNAINSNEYSDIYKRIIVVGSLGKNLQPSWFSNGGQRVDIFAPGEEIFSTLPGNVFSNQFEYLDDSGQTQYSDWSGTSMACPLIAGVAAMAWSINSELTGENIRNIIRDSQNTEENAHMLIDAEKAVITAAKYDVEKKAYVQNNYGIIQGFVVDKDKLKVEDNAITDGAIANAKITAINVDSKEKIDTATDSSGHFELILPPGKYNINVDAEGYISEIGTKDIEVRVGEVTYLDDWVKLEKIKSALSPESAVEIYLKNKDVWMINPEYRPMNGYGYSFIDLDFDGTLELISSISDGSARMAANNYYKIRMSDYSVQEVNQSIIESDADYFNGINYLINNETLFTKLYRNNKSNSLIYYATDFLRVSTGDYAITYNTVELKNNTINVTPRYGYHTTDAGAYGTNNPAVEEYWEYSGTKTKDLTNLEYESKMNYLKTQYTDMNLSYGSVEGETIESASASKQKDLLLEAYKKFNYSGFSFSNYKLKDVNESTGTDRSNQGSGTYAIFLKKQTYYDKNDKAIASESFMGGNQRLEQTKNGVKKDFKYDQYGHLIEAPKQFDSQTTPFFYSYSNSGNHYLGKATSGNLTSEIEYNGSQLLHKAEYYKEELVHSEEYEYYENGAIKSQEIKDGVIIFEVDHAILNLWQKTIYSPQGVIIEEIRYNHHNGELEEHYGEIIGDMVYTYENGRLTEVNFTVFDPDTGEKMDDYCTQIKRVYNSPEKDILQTVGKDDQMIFYYDSDGLLIKEESEGIIDLYEYDNYGRLIRQTTTNENTSGEDSVVKVVKEYEIIQY